MNNLLLKALNRQKQYKESFFKENKVYPRLQVSEKREKNFVDNGLVKIVAGPRRAGKSTYLFSLLKGKDFMYVNFDDVEVLSYFTSINELLDLLKELYGDTKLVLFDEIQNLHAWPLILNQMHREGYNVFVTGSNSNLFNTKFATHLTGRHLIMDLFPFNYKEYLSVCNFEKNIESEFQFMTRGGFPEVVINNMEPGQYTETLLKNIVYKDVILRHGIKYPNRIELLMGYLVSSVTDILNFETISKILKIDNYKTLYKYLDYIEESYAFLFLPPFSFKPRERLTFDRKIFVVDNSFLHYKNFFNSSNKGIFFENLVFVELLKKEYKVGEKLFYYRTVKNYEVDFLIKKDLGSVSRLIQVSYDMSFKKTEDREVRALVEASKELKCDDLYIITFSEKRVIEKDDKVIKVIPFKEFCEEWANLD